LRLDPKTKSHGQGPRRSPFRSCAGPDNERVAERSPASSGRPPRRAREGSQFQPDLVLPRFEADVSGGARSEGLAIMGEGVRITRLRGTSERDLIPQFAVDRLSIQATIRVWHECAWRRHFASDERWFGGERTGAQLATGRAAAPSASEKHPAMGKLGAYVGFFSGVVLTRISRANESTLPSGVRRSWLRRGRWTGNLSISAAPWKTTSNRPVRPRSVARGQPARVCTVPQRCQDNATLLQLRSTYKPTGNLPFSGNVLFPHGLHQKYQCRQHERCRTLPNNDDAQLCS